VNLIVKVWKRLDSDACADLAAQVSSADGVGVPRVTEPIADLCENVCLTTADANYAWVNTRQIWAPGTVNLAAGKVHIDAYMQ
jgi:hypothetical protein